MHQILIIIAIVGIGYLLYRSLIIKRQPTDENPQVRNQQVEKNSVERSPDTAVPTTPEQRAKPLQTLNSDPAPSVENVVVAQTPVQEDPKPASVPPAENPVGEEALEEAHQAKAKAAEKAHIATAEKATKSKLEQFVGRGEPGDQGPEVPSQVEIPAAALRETDDPLARHRLYQQIVEQCYRGRDEKSTQLALLHYASAHLKEFAEISEPLKKQNGGKLPQVATYKHYAAVLTEAGQYEEAIDVCQQALSYGLKDGTKTGYQGRLERIEKLKARRQG